MGASAQAADPGISPPPPVFVDTFHRFQIRVGVAGAVPLGDGQTKIYDAGAFNPLLIGLPPGNPGLIGLATGLSAGPGSLVPGATTNTSWSVIPKLEISYFVTKNWALSTICCLSHNTVTGTGVLAGSTLAKTFVFPPTLLLQYHFTNWGAFQPYIGVGVNYTTFWGTRAGNNNWNLFTHPASFAAIGLPPVLSIPGFNSTFYSASISPSWGVVGQVGANYMFNDHWGVYADVKYIMMEPRARAWIASFSAQGLGPVLGVNFLPVKADVRINPLVVGAGLTYRFGGAAAAPVLAAY
jgi:outer membrane protein W